MMHFFKLVDIILNIENLLRQILEALHNIESKNVSDEKAWMDSYEVRSYFNIHRSTLYRWKKEKILCPSRIGRKDMYLRTDVIRAMQVSRFTT